MTNDPEHELPTTAAIEFRGELLENGWPDDRRVAELAGEAPGPGAATYAVKARARGALLGVWSAPTLCFVYPDFQFDSSGDIRKEVAELLAVLPSEDDRGGWRRTFWLYSPHPLLDERAPAEIFMDDPTRVITVAREEFLGDPDATW
ncbi:hypothetical protein [Trinickia dinghuensis]|uniref:Uncharacterized protein n=1 Tax=Trinickia dinghuensis TaxID=2291023 RepID=A0A3D8K1M2_9BURK|nr:hypothetical protein [Trinickia dinghuensis]RDU99333.1 hypothetical protein DWV00_09500 [Trinickia dinghuensis]